MLIRQVRQNAYTKLYAYLEFSDEDKTICRILGDKEFKTNKEAVDHSLGFTPMSYTWEEPKKQKSGMYGEMPKITIGDYFLSQMSSESNTAIWIENSEGEGAEISCSLLKADIKEIFNKYF